MTAKFPRELRNLPSQFMYVLAMVGFFLLFALLYEPTSLMRIFRTGEGYVRISDMVSFNIAISCAIILVSMSILRTVFYLTRERFTTALTKYALWCVFEILVTSSFLALFFCLVGRKDPSAGGYFYYLVICVKNYLCIAIFPYVILTLLYLLQEALSAEPMQDDTRIRFYDNRHLLRFATTVSSVVFIEAEENYIMVHYLENGIPKKFQIRNTMKSLEPMCETGSFVRVHRSYIVNPKHIKQLRKDPEGFFFADLDCEAPAIPVSKRYQKSLDALL